MIEEITTCGKCGLPISGSGVVGWMSNWQDSDRLIPELTDDEPWWTACPASVETLEKFPTFGLWARAQVEYTSPYQKVDKHEPILSLAQLLHETERSENVPEP